MLVYIFMLSCDSLYAFTSSEDGANLPNEGHGRWERQGTIDLATGKASDIGIDSEQAIRDVRKNGYHVASVAEMLRRRSQRDQVGPEVTRDMARPAARLPGAPRN